MASSRHRTIFERRSGDSDALFRAVFNGSADALAGEHPEFAKPVTQSIGFVDQVTAEIRSLSRLLHPPLIDELGLGG
jgi:hypothetical protein